LAQEPKPKKGKTLKEIAAQFLFVGACKKRINVMKSEVKELELILEIEEFNSDAKISQKLSEIK